MTTKMQGWSDGLTKLKAGQTPGSIYRNFEDELGYINTHLCIADAALRDFAASSNVSADFVRQRVRANGHRRLNVGVLTIEATLELSYNSHIALLLGRVANLCSSLQRHPLVDRKLSQQAQGDFFRKSLWIIMQSQHDKPIPTPIEDALAHEYVPQSALSNFDRLREARNVRFHAASPNSNKSTRFDDVLICSKLSQQVSRCLCRALAGTPDAIAGALRKRYGNLSEGRRGNAARAALAQEYLLDSNDAHGVLSDLAW